MTNLFLCQIGPVQSFIAAGRRTQDLYVGSRLLSQLARAGLHEATRKPGFMPIFPIWDDNQQFPKGVPHRFAFVCDDDAQAVGEAIENAVRDRWLHGYAEKVYMLLRDQIGEGDWEAVYQNQMDNWLEFYWVSVPYRANDHATCFTQASTAMAQRKLLRHFPQIDEHGRKCTLTGSQSALPLDWERLKRALKDDFIFRPHEYLGTVALIKRLIQNTDADLGDGKQKYKPKSTDAIAGADRNQKRQQGREVENYLAVLHIDGDGMGKALSNIKNLTEHQEFSRKLAFFADEQVPNIIKQYGGDTYELIYAGGDDVLALLPLRHVLECAYQLRLAFGELMGFSSSAGIAITPYDFPLDLALDIARQAEETAKEGIGRNAIMVTEAHGTGTIREAGGEWDVIPLVNILIGYFADGTLSGKLGYDILTIASDMGGVVPPEARLAELSRIIKRRLAENVADNLKKHILGNDPDKGNLAQVIATLAEGRISWQGMAHWAILARFIAQAGA